MSRILAIFRKDARHLWLHIALYAALMALAALLDPTYTHNEPSAYAPLSSLLPLACWVLVVSVIHEEKLPGNRQYWLTRPIPWRELLAAKALFVTAFVNAPLLLCHVAVWWALGIPVTAHVPELLWKQVFFTAFYILPVAALAAMTRNIGQVILGGLAIVAPWALGEQMIFARYRLSWGGQEWLPASAVAAVLACGISAVLLVQYAGRRTVLSRMLAGAVALAAAAVLFAPLQRALGGRTAGAVRISLDARPGRPDVRQPNGWNTVALEIPVRVDGLPGDTQLMKNSMSVRIVSAAGTWRPNLAEGGLHEVAGGRGWLTVMVSKPVFLQMRDGSVDVVGQLEYTLFRGPEALAPPKEHAVVAPHIGVCRTAGQAGDLSVVCYTPFPRAALYLGTPGGGANWVIPMGFVGPPIPTDSGFESVRKFSSQLPFASWQDFGGARMIAMHPVARVSVPFAFEGVRLREFAPRE